jgi:hypothetical protein
MSKGSPMGGLGAATGVILPLSKNVASTKLGEHENGRKRQAAPKAAPTLKVPLIGKSVSKSAPPLEELTIPVPLRPGRPLPAKENEFHVIMPVRWLDSIAFPFPDGSKIVPSKVTDSVPLTELLLSWPMISSGPKVATAFSSSSPMVDVRI